MMVNYGGFFKKGQPGEIPVKRELNHSADWYGMEWKIPAVYFCKEGIVLDLCRSVSKDILEDYYRKWKPLMEENEITPVQEMQICRENPFSREYKAVLSADGRSFAKYSLSSVGWYGLEGCGVHSPEAKELMECYSCEESRAWQFDRLSFPWPDGKQIDVHRMEITLSARPVYYEGSPHFAAGPEDGGKQVTVREPSGERECRIEIKSCEAAVLKEELCQGGREWPRHFQILTYQLHGWEGSERALRPVIRDCGLSDEPRRKKEGEGNGARGVSVLTVREQHEDPAKETVCSSLHFEPQGQTEWMVLFPKIEAEEKTIVLTGQE